jgi:hypothetical protein
LEEKLGRGLKPQKNGRPKKQKNQYGVPRISSSKTLTVTRVKFVRIFYRMKKF